MRFWREQDIVPAWTPAKHSMLRWLENAESDVVEFRRMRAVSRRCADLEIVVAAQLVAAKRRLIVEHAEAVPLPSLGGARSRPQSLPASSDFLPHLGRLFFHPIRDRWRFNHYGFGAEAEQIGAHQV